MKFRILESFRGAMAGDAASLVATVSARPVGEHVQTLHAAPD